MGILTRRQGDCYVITSDRAADAPATKRAPVRMNGAYEVWTGDRWSTEHEQALEFASLDAADEYVRANLGRVLG